MNKQIEQTAGDLLWKEQRQSKTHEQGHVDINSLRKKAIIQAAIGLSIATIIFVFWSKLIAYIAFGITGFTLAAAVLSPTFLHMKIVSFLSWLGLTIGRILTFALLIPLYYLFFLPFGFLFRQGKKSTIKQYLEPDKRTYWTDLIKENVDKKQDYTKQF